MKNKNKPLILLLLVVFCSGCTSTVRMSPGYKASVQKIKTIAVMPPDIEVYKLTAGGVRELIDEWSEDSKEYVKEALKKYLSANRDFKIKFMDEDDLKSNYGDIWKGNKALYNAVSSSALIHAYSPENTFKSKLQNFDYTLGSEVRDLSSACDADALLFVWGFDHESTAGRKALGVWNFFMGAALGVAILPVTPSGMVMGLVDGKTGNVEWMNISPPGGEYSFVSSKHMDGLVKWLTRDFARKDK